MSSSSNDASRNFTTEQMQEVSSLIHNELQCVTVQRITLTAAGLSRTRASHLLLEVAKESTDKTAYQATLCQVHQEPVTLVDEPDIHRTVFKLHTQEWNKPADCIVDEATSTLMALALTPSTNTATAESMAVAHERDMALYRDLLQDSSAVSSILLDPAVKIDAIQPAADVRAAYEESLQAGRIQTGNATLQGAPETVSRVSASTSRFQRLPKKVTTAAEFFDKKKDDKKPAKAAAAATAKPKAPKPSKAVSVASSTSTATVPKKSKSPFAVAAAASKSKKTAANTAAAAKEDEKENSQNDVGNADDFVGDLDDDEDDYNNDDEDDDNSNDNDDNNNDDDASMQEPAVVRENKQACKRRSIAIADSDDDDDDKGADTAKESKPTVTGAMDAFTAPSQKVEAPDNADGGKKKRRRKRLSEKITMDPNGYLHTETQEVWEEVPSDEDETPSDKLSNKLPSSSKPAAVAVIKKKKGAAAGKSSMKQGNLMGFFKKK